MNAITNIMYYYYFHTYNIRVTEKNTKNETSSPGLP
jgi:hypothetical protein